MQCTNVLVYCSVLIALFPVSLCTQAGLRKILYNQKIQTKSTPLQASSLYSPNALGASHSPPLMIILQTRCALLDPLRSSFEVRGWGHTIGALRMVEASLNTRYKNLCFSGTWLLHIYYQHFLIVHALFLNIRTKQCTCILHMHCFCTYMNLWLLFHWLEYNYGLYCLCDYCFCLL